jgi:ParB family chromosome partitioning protein
LGRGLAALLEGADATAESELTELPVLQIRPNPFQPRQHFDPERLRELAESIRQQGVMQPILVRRGAEGYELLAGERRLRAAQMAGYHTIPALVKSANDQQALEVALLENLQREDLNPIEEARAYQRLQAEFQLTQDEVAQRVGRDRSSVTNMLRLLRLPVSLQTDIEAGRLSMGHARALLALDSEAAQQRLRDQIVADGLSVRETENQVRVEKRQRVAKPLKAAHFEAVEAALHRRLDAQVSIKPGRKRGKIEITYQGEEDLQRLLNLLNG